MNQMEREEQALEDDLAAGLISYAEFRRAMSDLQRDYRDAAQEVAWGAYERELDNW